MQAGPLRHRVIVQAPSAPVVEDGGGFTETWTKIHAKPTVAASVDPATARDIERRVGAQVKATISDIVTMRYMPDVTTKCRVLFGARTLHVRGVQNPGERNIKLILACEERV